MTAIKFSALAFAAALTASAPSLAALDLGDASVLSQQGQRLKVAVGYGSAPGERIPVTRFSVVEIRSEAKDGLPIARNFTISQPEKRNIVYLQSRELVAAEKLQLVMRSSDQPTKDVVYDLVVPPARSALTAAEPAPAMKKAKLKKRGFKKPMAKSASNKAGYKSPFKKSTNKNSCPCG